MPNLTRGLHCFASLARSDSKRGRGPTTTKRQRRRIRERPGGREGKGPHLHTRQLCFLQLFRALSGPPSGFAPLPRAGKAPKHRRRVCSSHAHVRRKAEPGRERRVGAAARKRSGESLYFQSPIHNCKFPRLIYAATTTTTPAASSRRRRRTCSLSSRT